LTLQMIRFQMTLLQMKQQKCDRKEGAVDVAVDMVAMEDLEALGE